MLRSRACLPFDWAILNRKENRHPIVCSDMWQAYLKVIAKKVPHAIRILDRFHVMHRQA
ncbi:transposase [Novipirellula artificiosorum]|uniref:transposase n=1 Tax=Novipirellula artificiosorum TaxID=2528016 RepID=UPI0036F3C29F